MSRSAACGSPISLDQHGAACSSENHVSSGTPPLQRSTPPSHTRPPPGAFFGDYVNNFSRGSKMKRFHHVSGVAENILDLRELVDASSSGKRNAHSPMATPGSHSRSVNSSVRQTPVLRPLRGLDPPTKILDFLFLGTVYDAQDANFLTQHNIRHIINVSMEEYWSADKRVVVYPFKMMDTVEEDISSIFKGTRNIIERCRQEFFKAKRDPTYRRKVSSTPTTPGTRQPPPPAVLVHCQKGRSRSATVVLAYLIYRNGWSVAEALDYVTKLRPVVEPNLGFMDALLKLQESMDPEERNRRCSQQSLCIRNIPLRTTPSMVSSFFEDRVGMVRSVVMHGLGGLKAKPAHTSEETTPSERQPAHHSAPPSESGSDNATPGAAHPEPLSPPAGDSQPSAHKGEATPAHTESTPAMCLIMFPCFENVKRAKEYAQSHMGELQKALGTVPDKEIKLMVPSKLKPINGSLAGSFGRRPN